MKAWAENFGNLNYETLCEFMLQLHDKILSDSNKDRERGRKKLASKLLDLSDYMFDVYYALVEIADLCKPFNGDKDGDSKNI